LAVFVAISHQQYRQNNPGMMFAAFPWLALPFPNQPASYNDYETTVGLTYYSLPSNLVYLLSNAFKCLSSLIFSCYCAVSNFVQRKNQTLSNAIRLQYVGDELKLIVTIIF
jgi:hypothetical protein